MSFDHSIRSGQRLLRCGYTTGTCAALAAQGAARLLLTGQVPQEITLLTPKGWEVSVRPDLCRMQQGAAVCSVRKDAGDDADVTDGLPVTATVTRTDATDIVIDGGKGVGRVTKPGLDQPVGAAAINHVPRQMIWRQVKDVCRETGYNGGLSVIISVEGGEEAARRTFNPQLGVEGGLSILGTSGVVEPMSEQAIVDTIALEIHQQAAVSRQLILTPGNYGMDFLHGQGWDRRGVPVVKCSNFLGEALDCAAMEGTEQLLLVGHIGKLVKVAGGIMNTHSRYADCRTELFCAHAAMCGAGTAVCRALMEAATADACLEILNEAGLGDAVMDSLLSAIQQHLEHRVGNRCQVGAAVFSNQFGLLGITPPAKEMLQQW